MKRIRIRTRPRPRPPRCRFSSLRTSNERNCIPIPAGARRGDRHWWREYVALIEEGYIPHDEGGFYLESDYQRARHIVCDCGEDMDFRGFELVGSEGERIAYRTFAVCPMCRTWIEF